MEISRRADYAIRMVTALAATEGQPRSVRIVAEENDIPYAFARSIQHDLGSAGFILSRRGVNGGMVLTEKGRNLTLLELVESVQGTLSIAVCAREDNWCPHEANCSFHRVWKSIDRIVRNFLASVTVAQVVSGMMPHLAAADIMEFGAGSDMDAGESAQGVPPADMQSPDDCPLA
ncbi:MAG: Rrf2 family transcriptional regulator [Coriobacteriales bacterium]|jgi:Rrf2 family protein|nr:Rrf2 family transcriptional regulator [Coriobacteriales bacterium]